MDVCELYHLVGCYNNNEELEGILIPEGDTLQMVYKLLIYSNSAPGVVQKVKFKDLDPMYVTKVYALNSKNNSLEIWMPEYKEFPLDSIYQEATNWTDTSYPGRFRKVYQINFADFLDDTEQPNFEAIEEYMEELIENSQIKDPEANREERALALAVPIIVLEYCPNCNNEVVLENKFEIQTCPKCGVQLKPCSLCLISADDCENHCPLEQSPSEVVH